MGTLATLGKDGISVLEELSSELGLATPLISWHTARDNFAEIIFSVSMVVASLSKIANEVAILMRTEVDELREPFSPGRGGSTTMPQKRLDRLLRQIVRDVPDISPIRRRIRHQHRHTVMAPVPRERNLPRVKVRCVAIVHRRRRRMPVVRDGAVHRRRQGTCVESLSTTYEEATRGA